MDVVTKRNKRSKCDSDGTVETYIEERRRLLIQDRQAAPDLVIQAERIEAELSSMKGRHLVRERMSAQRAAKSLREEALVRESMSREHEFETKVAQYMRIYQKGGNKRCARTPETSMETYVRSSGHIQQHKDALKDEFVADTSGHAARVVMSTRDECPHCGPSSHLLVCSRESVLTCHTCGYSMAYLDTTSASISFEDTTPFSQYSYKRVNHYMQWVHLIQAKESHKVPDDVLEQVMRYMYDVKGVREPTEVTPPLVHIALRQLRLKRAYDHVSQITARISGVQAPRVDAATEVKLKNMFLRIQPAFQRHAKGRTNFISYSYVLYQSFRILGLDHMVDNIVLLKGREKLEANHLIFKDMCKDLGWKAYDLPA